MKAVPKIVLLLAICFAFLGNAQCERSTQSVSFTTAVVDPAQTWIFKNDNGYLGEMKLNPDGTIAGYDHYN